MMKVASHIVFASFALTACASAPNGTPSLSTAIALATQQDAPAYQSALIDLNHDGQEDAVVLLSGTDWCGTGGCTMLIFKNDHYTYSLLSRSTVTRSPIRVSSVATNGWKDLIVSTRGVGDAIMQFDGTAYPGNPSMQPAATSAQVAGALIIIE